MVELVPLLLKLVPPALYKFSLGVLKLIATVDATVMLLLTSKTEVVPVVASDTVLLEPELRLRVLAPPPLAKNVRFWLVSVGDIVMPAPDVVPAEMLVLEPEPGE